jgi:PAS domain S-box-containing protein
MAVDVRPPKHLLIGVIVFGSVAAALLVFLFYRDRLASAREEQGRALITIAEVKAAELASWREARLSDAQVLSGSKGLARLVRQAIAHGTASAGAGVPGLVELLRARQNYAAVRLFDARGRLRLSSPPASPALAADASSFAAEAIRQRKVVFEDFHAVEGVIHLALFAPLFEEGADPVGVVEFQIDPARYLYPSLNTWPTISQSGETLLVRRDGDEVVYLNELRHQKGTALTLRLPVTRTGVPAVQAALGREGVIEGGDYRNIAVLGAARHVPGSPWFLVTKIDRAEAFAALLSSTRSFALNTILVVVLCGCGILLAWSRRGSQQYQQLYESEAKRRALASHYEYLHRYANDIIILLDDSTARVLEVNDRALESYGYTRDKFLTLQAMDLRDPSVRATFDEQWDSDGARNGVIYETLARRADGSAFPVEISSRVITVDERAFRQAIIRDISERRRTQDELLRSQTSLLQAEAIARLGTWEVESPDSAAERYVWSDEVYRIFGVDRKTFQPSFETFAAAVYPDDREVLAAAVRQSRLSSQPLDVEHRIVRPDGTVRHVREHAKCLLSNGGGSRWIGSVQDITEYKQLEEQLLHAQKMESLGRLAGGVAHDFNNLLTVINGYSDLAHRSLREGDPLRESIEEIRKAGQSAATLTRQLLVFSRKQRVEAQPVDLTRVVSDAQRMLQRLVGEDIELDFKCDPKLGTTVADPGQMQQVIMNLVVNARDAMPHGGSIFLETANVEMDGDDAEYRCEARPGSYVMLAVSDTGIGMTEEVKNRVFEPFFTTKPRGMGTGLGLATVYGIVKQSGGWIWVYSEPGKGTTFKVYLPRVEDPVAVAVPTELPPVAERPATILLVEDQAEVRRLAANVLRSRHYTVIEAVDAEAALVACKRVSGPVHLLLTDVVLPGISGPQLVELLVRLYPEIRTLFMSGYSEHVSLRSGAIAGDAAYLDKPFTAGTLAAKVCETLGRPVARRVPVVSDERAGI